MQTRFTLLAAAALSALAACGGGGSGSGGTNNPYGVVPSTAPTATPTPGSTSAPQGNGGNAPLQETVAGALAFVNPANHHTLYFIDGDTPAGTACNAAAACTTEWPVLTPTAGSQSTGGLSIVTRTDGIMQWSFNGHALYEFSGDSGPDQSNGVYGPWHMARP